MSKRVLILEDNQSVVRALKESLASSDPEIQIEDYSTSKAVRDYVNHQPADYWDVIILDYFATDGTFHDLDFSKFNPERIISISSMQDKNTAAENKGIKRITQKRYSSIDQSIEEIVEHTQQILNR